ncbi:MAG: hypothetical protein ACT4P6_02490 [Gemmatimonadaceae bacterium]
MAPSREEIAVLVIEQLQRVLVTRGKMVATLGEDTMLIGAPEAVLDSLGWVVFVLDLEQELEDRQVPDSALTSALDSKGILEGVTVRSLVDLIEGVTHRGRE